MRGGYQVVDLKTSPDDGTTPCPGLYKAILYSKKPLRVRRYGETCFFAGASVGSGKGGAVFFTQGQRYVVNPNDTYNKY